MVDRGMLLGNKKVGESNDEDRDGGERLGLCI